MVSDTLRRQALALFEAGVNAADPGTAVKRALARTPEPEISGRRLLVAVGKAAGAMARAAIDAGVTHDRAMVITNYENASGMVGAVTYAAGHPVPDLNGARAGQAVLSALQALGPDDRVLALISGGGSALLPAPANGISLDDKAEVSRLLLASGADINQMNLIRQQLSNLKGGGFLRAAAPARVRALILSDVVGDDLRAIASGPTVGPIGTPKEARALLCGLGLWQAVAPSVRVHLETPRNAAPLPVAENELIGSNAQSVAAMAAAEPTANLVHDPLCGNVADAAARVVAAGATRGVSLFGGETTVEVTGAGLGGRNQELALRAAMGAEAAGWDGDWVFLSGGTDGRDGPTDAAGGIVDAATLSRMRAAGVDPADVLARNDSYHGLKAAGALLMTGATGTNVADLQVLIRR